MTSNDRDYNIEQILIEGIHYLTGSTMEPKTINKKLIQSFKGIKINSIFLITESDREITRKYLKEALPDLTEQEINDRVDLTIRRILSGDINNAI